MHFFLLFRVTILKATNTPNVVGKLAHTDGENPFAACALQNTDYQSCTNGDNHIMIIHF